MTMLVQFKGGPADGELRHIGDDEKRVHIAVRDGGDPMTTSHKIVAYEDSGRFTLHGEPARVFAYMGSREP